MLGWKSLVVGALLGVLALGGGGVVFAQIAAPSPTEAAPPVTSTTKGDIAASKAKVATDQDGFGGTVIKVEGSTVTLQRDTVTQTVTTDANTRFLKEGNQDGSLGDIQVGMKMKAAGRKGEDGTLHATEVAFGGIPGGNPLKDQAGAGGKVVKIDGDTITVQNDAADVKTQAIVTDGNTRFLRVEGERDDRVEKAGSLSDITTGDYIKAGGSLDENGSLHAEFVAYGWPKS